METFAETNKNLLKLQMLLYVEKEKYFLLIKIREKVPRESFSTFQNLLENARDVETISREIDMDHKIIEKVQTKSDDQNDTIKSRCTYCRKKNHLAEDCYKKLEDERKSKTKAEEVSLSCYGCGRAGYYRSKLP